MKKDVLATTSTTIYAIEDSFVRKGSPNTNYGNNSTLSVTNYDNDDHSYLKFDLSPLAGTTITSARFHMRMSNDGLTGQLKMVSSTSWQESTINWNNKPAMGSKISDLLNAENRWVTDSNWVRGIDVTSYVNSKKGQMMSLGIEPWDKSYSYGTAAYMSRETSDKPHIVVVHEGSPPTPTLTPTIVPTQIPTATPPMLVGNIENLNFGITNLNPWIQSICGDIRIDTGINNPVPSGYYSMVTNASCTNPGIAFSGDQPYSFGQGQVSSSGWIVGGSAYHETYTDPSGIFSSYTNMTNRTAQAAVTPIDLATICTISNCTLPANLSHGVYRANGNLNLNAYTFPGNQKYVFLINGNLTINGNILIPSGSSALFTAANDIIVSASVGRTPSSAAPNIEGIYSAGKSFIVNASGNCNDLRLNIAGGVITNASLAGGSFQNNRDLCGNNAAYPTISFAQRLDFLLNAPEFIMKKNTVFWEGAP